MKLLAQKHSLFYDEQGNPIIAFVINNPFSKKVFEQMDLDATYSLEFKPVKDRRTIQQNKYMWQLISELAQAINGDNDIMAIYCNALEMFSNKFVVLKAPLDSQKILANNFRAVRLLTKEENNSIILGVFQCFEGSSKFNKKEMAQLIDGLLLMAEEANLNHIYWRDVLNEVD